MPGLVQNVRRKLAHWNVLYRAYRPALAIPSALKLILARELADHGRIGPKTSIRVTLTHPIRCGIRLRPGGSDVFTLQEVLCDEVYAGVAEVLPTCGQMIDLGANIGLSSLYLVSRYPAAKLLAVEPHSGSFDLLLRNLKPWIESGQCRPLHAAAWSEDRAVAPAVSVDAWYQASFRVVARDVSDCDSIRGLSMEALRRLSGADQIDLVKIDVEGAEAELFRSENLGWLQHVGCLAVEFHEDSRERASFDEVIALHGFNVVRETSHTVIAVNRALSFMLRDKDPRID
jgi:FkbM family methyltransferase